MGAMRAAAVIIGELLDLDKRLVCREIGRSYFDQSIDLWIMNVRFRWIADVQNNQL